MRILEGAIYTVDEVSDLLGIPRPTLYRYLREYSIPHLRKAGRISIPEDSFDRIREARDLHKEGLGTESVRRQLREGSTADTGELDRRLDSLHETLESLRGDIRERPASTDEVALSPTLRTILARQSLLMSAMFNLTEMVEDLLLASGKPRKPLFEDLGMRGTLPERPVRDQLEIPGTVTSNAGSGAVQGSGVRSLATRSTGFGSLGRRRRRGVLALIAVLLLAVSLAWAIPALIGGTQGSVPRVTEAADEPPGAPKAMAAASETTSADHTTSQEESGAEAAAGDSKPDGDIEVPDVSGKSLEDAASTISDAGLRVAAIKTEASQEDPETIIRTHPPAGASARSGAPVILTMSGGPTGTPPGIQPASVSANASASTSASASTAASATASATASTGASAR